MPVLVERPRITKNQLRQPHSIEQSFDFGLRIQVEKAGYETKKETAVLPVVEVVGLIGSRYSRHQCTALDRIHFATSRAKRSSNTCSYVGTEAVRCRISFRASSCRFTSS